MSRLPILALPFLADGAILLFGKISRHFLEVAPLDTEFQGGEADASG